MPQPRPENVYESAVVRVTRVVLSDTLYAWAGVVPVGATHESVSPVMVAEETASPVGGEGGRLIVVVVVVVVVGVVVVVVVVGGGGGAVVVVP